MRSLCRVAGVLCTAVLLGGVAAPAAAAPPGPHLEEWWFSGWAIQQKVWPRTTGDGVTVAVLDSGVNAGIPEFAGAVLPGADFNGTGTDGRTDTDDGDGHGTAMAALIAAQGGPTGWVGVAPGAKILPIVRGSGDDSVGDGIRYAADHGADVISMSFGGPLACSRVLQDAVTYAIDKDVVLVAAAGNSADSGNLPESPASCPGVVAVGALDGNSLKPWVKSQRQPYVALAAPGAQVGSVGKDGGLFHYGAGTSQATALTSGVVALMRSALPDLSGREIVQRLLNTTKDVGPKGVDPQTGSGLILPQFALVTEVPPSAPNPPYERLDQVRGDTGSPGPGSTAPAPAPPAGDAAGDDNDSGVNGTEALILGGGILLVVLVVVALVGRARRRRPAPVGQAPWPPPGGGPPYPPRQP